MAKLKAPLMSFGARGKLAGSLVFFPWKGIDAVREYVIPANPRTAAQLTQRGYFADAIDEWHAMLPTSADRTAWNRFSGTVAKIMSGFNLFCRTFIDEAILGNAWERLSNLRVAGVAATAFGVEVDKAALGNAPTLRWGSSPTFMPESVVMTDLGGDVWHGDTSGLTAENLYYFWVDVGSSGTDYARTGIAAQRTTA